jgi:hypothetical protein
MPTTNRHVGQDVSQQAVQHQRPPHPSSYQHDYSQQQYSLPPVYPQHPPHVPFQQGQYSQSQYSQQPNVDQYSPHQSYGQQENTPTVWPSSAPVTLPQLPNHRIDVASNEDRARNCIEEFDEYFGKNPFALWALQKLCRVAWINPPDSIQGCRTVCSFSPLLLTSNKDSGIKRSSYEYFRCCGGRGTNRSRVQHVHKQAGNGEL